MKAKNTRINGRVSLENLVNDRSQMQSVKGKLLYHGLEDGAKYSDLFASAFLSKYATWTEYEKRAFVKNAAGLKSAELREKIEAALLEFAIG